MSSSGRSRANIEVEVEDISADEARTARRKAGLPDELPEQAGAGRGVVYSGPEEDRPTGEDAPSAPDVGSTPRRGGGAE